jgi:hypothetical protein
VNEILQLEKKQRDVAGALGKADSFAPRKKIVADTYARLKIQLGKNPQLKVLIIELKRGHAEYPWKGGSVKQWVARLNKGEKI